MQLLIICFLVYFTSFGMKGKIGFYRSLPSFSSVNHFWTNLPTTSIYISHLCSFHIGQMGYFPYNYQKNNWLGCIYRGVSCQGNSMKSGNKESLQPLLFVRIMYGRLRTTCNGRGIYNNNLFTKISMAFPSIRLRDSFVFAILLIMKRSMKFIFSNLNAPPKNPVAVAIFINNSG